MQAPYSFKELIKELQSAYAPTCARNNSLIVNDINADISINIDKELVAFLLTSIINTLIIRSSYSCIRISAKKYHNVVLMHINNNNIRDFSLDAPFFERMQSLARVVGGCISLNDYRNNATTVTISFTNKSAA